MDNMKTGALIRELRKEKGFTQNDLARQLHITDRAVSKWERGLCAPDMALLEPLANILGVSMIELIEGERALEDEHSKKIASAMKSIVDYSQNEIAGKMKIRNRTHFILAAVCFLAAVLLCALFLWQRGYFAVIEKCPAPTGTACAVVYDKELSGKNFSSKDAISVIVDLSDGREYRTTYGDCAYQGLWWSPDGQKYVLSLDHYHGGPYLELVLFEQSSSKNLVAYLTMGVEMTELAKYGHISEDGWSEIDYQFLQWSKDSKAMLIYYSYPERNENVHEGYFWYDYETGHVRAVLELKTEKGNFP